MIGTYQETSQSRETVESLDTGQLRHWDKMEKQDLIFPHICWLGLAQKSKLGYIQMRISLEN